MNLSQMQHAGDPARPAVIFGKGGHARVIASYLPHTHIRFAVERDPEPGDLLQSDFFAAPDLEADCFIGIGDNTARRRYFDRLAQMGARLPACIGPSAWIASDAVVGRGLFLGAFALIGSQARVGDNVIINTSSTVDHDVVLEDDAQVTAAVTFGGGSTVGRAAFIGLKAVILPGVHIGAGGFVAAGAVVTRTTPPGVRVAGLPAVIMPPRQASEGA